MGQRCIVPIAGYSEWRNDAGKKLKNYISPEAQDLFSIAGLIKEDTFTIITCQPTPEIARIHNRMPVILVPEAEREWLNPGYTFNNLAHYLVAYNQAKMNIQEYQPTPPRQGSFFG